MTATPLYVYWCRECLIQSPTRFHRVEGRSLSQGAAAQHECAKIEVVPIVTAAGVWVEQRTRLAEALQFYADPETYFGIAFLPDPPCGLFVEDFSECEHPDGGKWVKPGKLAREVLAQDREEREQLDALAAQADLDGERVKAEVIEALESWGTDWYGPNAAYKPAQEQARRALRLIRGCRVVAEDDTEEER